MNCHMCGQREATIHLLEMIDGEQKSVWLCGICASGRAGRPGPEMDDLSLQNMEMDSGESASLASFLGQVFEAGEKPAKVKACPECGYEIKNFQHSNRLGCSRCYPHFRAQVVPMLSRFHRHALHLGKVPSAAGGLANQQGEITRMRVALEKAIQTEDYEQAASLRDQMRALIAERDLLRGADNGEGGRS